jgi:hypothetical protein
MLVLVVMSLVLIVSKFLDIFFRPALRHEALVAKLPLRLRAEAGLFWLLGASFSARARFGEREVHREAVPCSLHYLSHCTLPALAYYIENHPATCSITSRTRQSSGKRSVSIIIARTRDRPSETGRQGKAGRKRYSEGYVQTSSDPSHWCSLTTAIRRSRTPPLPQQTWCASQERHNYWRCSPWQEHLL